MEVVGLLIKLYIWAGYGGKKNLNFRKAETRAHLGSTVSPRSFLRSAHQFCRSFGDFFGWHGRKWWSVWVGVWWMESISLKRQNLQPCHSSGQYLCWCWVQDILHCVGRADDKVGPGKRLYIYTSFTKAGLPGYPGCCERATMMWSAIQEAWKEKKYLHAAWLDIANAYRSLPHKLIQKAMNFFPISDGVQDTITWYYDQIRMRFPTEDYVTSWQTIEVGVPVECTISPLLFVMINEKYGKRSWENGW